MFAKNLAEAATESAFIETIGKSKTEISTAIAW
jgi:hypothetical protein